MNDIEQNTSSSAPIAPNTYPKVELSSPQLRTYAQWHSASQGPSTSSLATSAQSPNTYGQPYASSLSVVNEIHTQPLPEPNNMGPTMSPPHPMTSANPFQQQSRNTSTPIYAPMLLSSAMMMSQGVVRTPMSTPALMTALSSTGSGNMDPLSTTNQNVLSNATISRPPSIVHASPIHKQPAGQHSNSTLEVSSSTMDTALTSTSTPPMQSSSSTPQTEHFYPAQVHSGSPASAAVPTSLTTSSSTRARSMSYSGPYAFPHFGFSSYPTSSPPVPGAATYTPHPLAQQPITLSSPGVEFSSTTPAQTSSYADPDGVAETGTKARSSPLSSDAVGYYNADLPTSGTPSPMPLSIPGSNKGPGLLRLSIPMSATNKTLGTTSQFAQATQNYRQQEHYGSQASGDTYVGQQRERDNALPPPLPPLASSIATGGVSTLPRSMSTGSIHGSTVSVYAPHGGHQALHRQPNGNHPLFNSAVTAFSPMSGPYGSTSSSSGSLSSPSPPASYTTNPAPNAPRSSSRLAGPPLTIPSEPAFSQEANSVAPASATLQPNPYFPDQEYAYTSNVLMAGGHGGVSPVTITPTAAGNHSGSTGGVMSSMISMRGGTTSNGNSVPITPITGPPMGMGMNSGLGMMDGDETLDYYSRLADGLTSGIMTDEDATMDGQAHSLQQQALQRAQMDYGCTDENTDEATTRMMMLGVMTPTHPTSNGNVSPRHISSSGLAMTPTTSTGPGFASINSAGNSPMGGVTRTDRKRRSTTFTAGPNAAAGASRSRSGTLASGGAIQLGGGSSSSALGISSASLLQSALPPMQQSPSQLTANHSLSYAHPQQTYSVPHPLGAQLHALSPMSTMPLQSSLSSASLSTLSSAGSMPSSAVGASLSVNSNLPNNSPLAMKELSPTIKPVIEEYLLRYLNHLCMNPNAKDRMGHQIHQMYTARRIQRYEQLYGWRPLKFRIEAFVNGFVDLLTARGMSQDVTMKIPHYLNNSKLFSRFNESGNRMKSQGQTIWRVRARCKADISGMDVTVGVGQNIVANTAGHPPSAFSQSTMHHQVGMSPQQIQQQQQVDDGLMMAPDPLLWEFLPYERCIVGQPPLAIVGTAWQWNMKVHDHWTPRKKVSWNFVASPAAAANGTSPQESTAASPTSPTGSSSSILMPKWLSLQGSKLKGTPTHPGMYPITVEATFQDDNDPEPVVVRGHFTIQVSKAIGGWKAKMPVPEGLIGSPREGMEDIDGDEDSPEDQGSGGMMLGGAGPSNGGGMQAVTFSSLLGGRTSTYENMYGGHSLTGQSTPLQYVTTPNSGGHVRYYAYAH